MCLGSGSWRYVTTGAAIADRKGVGAVSEDAGATADHRPTLRVGRRSMAGPALERAAAGATAHLAPRAADLGAGEPTVHAVPV